MSKDRYCAPDRGHLKKFVSEQLDPSQIKGRYCPSTSGGLGRAAPGAREELDPPASGITGRAEARALESGLGGASAPEGAAVTLYNEELQTRVADAGGGRGRLVDAPRSGSMICIVDRGVWCMLPDPELSDKFPPGDVAYYYECERKRKLGDQRVIELCRTILPGDGPPPSAQLLPTYDFNKGRLG